MTKPKSDCLNAESAQKLLLIQWLCSVSTVIVFFFDIIIITACLGTFKEVSTRPSTSSKELGKSKREQYSVIIGSLRKKFFDPLHAIP